MANTYSLSETLYAADGVQALDRFLIEERGVEGYGLMQKAARAAFRQLLRHWPSAQRVVVLCGAGNNGGDGYLVALNALRQGHSVNCVAVADPETLSGDACRAWAEACNAGVEVRRWETLDESGQVALFTGEGVVVDAMLGTGARGRPRSPVDQVIERVNAGSLPVLAVDVPSGLDATTGTVTGNAVEAELTVTFIGQKAGLYTGQGPQYAGLVSYDALGAENWAEDFPEEPVARLVRWSTQQQALPIPSRVAHKGSFGHVLVIAGDEGYGGAGLLAAEAASRSGAGLVTLATHPAHVAPALSRCPSLMVRGIRHGSELAPLLEKADVLVCGPGIGQAAWGQQMLQQVLATDLPRVLDADALNLLAGQPALRCESQVLTPHPGEAARLLDCSIAEIESDRVTAARRLQEMFGGVTLLKGAGTVIARPDTLPAIIAGANPGMATGGMGDVLSGICGAMLAQAVKSAELPAGEAIATAAAAHLAAADYASQSRGYRSLLPADVIEALSRVFRERDSVRAGSGRDE